MIKLKDILLEAGLSKIPQSGESSGKPIKWRTGVNVKTEDLTINEILKKVTGIPYYNNVVDDYDNKDYSWSVTKKVMEYAKYLIDHPDSLKNLPPIIVVDNKLQDGAHRISAVYLIQQRLKPNDNFWKNFKLKVEFGDSSDVDKTNRIQEGKLPKILIPRRGGVERSKNYIIAIQRKIQNYIKNGMVGDLDLNGVTITELPDNLTKVGGVLDLGSSMVRKLPDNLKLIDAVLFLSYSEIESLPDNLTINGHLDVHSTDYLKKLPVNLTVEGDVLMSYADAKQLSDNTKIGGTLDLSGTEIKQLPNNLYVGGDLDLTESEIEVLPKDLSVGGDLYVMNTPVGREYTENQLKRMLPNVKGDIYTTRIENIDI